MLPNETTQKFRAQTTGYITASLGFVAGLAWNDAIKSAIETIFPAASSGVIMKFAYAGILTLVVFILGNYIFHLGQEKNEGSN